MSWSTKMSKDVKTDWKNVEGAFENKRRLHLRPSQHGIYSCPVNHCDHDGFTVERGCRKQIKTLPVPFYKSNQCRTHEIPSLTKDSEFAIGFRNWLKSKTAGNRCETQADQIISRALKFLKSVSNDDFSYEEVTENTVIDFYLGSGCNISEFIENLETSMEMGHSGQLGYINAQVI